MKRIVILTVSIVLVGISLCAMARAFPTLPADLHMVQPDPSLPKELSAFLGKYEWIDAAIQFCIIVEKIDQEKASIYIYRSGSPFILAEIPEGWERTEAKVFKEQGEYKLWYYFKYGRVILTSKGNYLITWSPMGSGQLRRIP